VVAARSQRAFIAGAPPKPPQANFYPAGATKERSRGVDQDAARARSARAPPVLHHDPPRPDGKFAAVPYSLEYQGELAAVAALLARPRRSPRSRR
jgi:hypothetical protein